MFKEKITYVFFMYPNADTCAEKVFRGSAARYIRKHNNEIINLLDCGELRMSDVKSFSLAPISVVGNRVTINARSAKCKGCELSDCDTICNDYSIAAQKKVYDRVR